MWQHFTEWVTIVSQVIGLIVLFIGLLGGLRSMWLWITRPRIKLYYDLNETFHKSFHPPDTHKIWIHVQVLNQGRRQTLRNCRGYLTRVLSVLSDGTLKGLRLFHTSLPLNWADLGGQKSYEVLPRARVSLDIGALTSKPLIFDIAAPGGNQLNSGTYLLEIQCLADNANKVAIQLRIKIPDTFENPVIKSWDKRNLS